MKFKRKINEFGKMTMPIFFIKLFGTRTFSFELSENKKYIIVVPII